MGSYKAIGKAPFHTSARLLPKFSIDGICFSWAPIDEYGAHKDKLTDELEDLKVTVRITMTCRDVPVPAPANFIIISSASSQLSATKIEFQFKEVAKLTNVHVGNVITIRTLGDRMLTTVRRGRCTYRNERAIRIDPYNPTRMIPPFSWFTLGASRMDARISRDKPVLIGV